MNSALVISLMLLLYLPSYAFYEPFVPQEEVRYCFLRAHALCSIHGKKVVYSRVIPYISSQRDEILADFQELLIMHYNEHFEVTFDSFSNLYVTRQEAEAALESFIFRSLSENSKVEFLPERSVFVKNRY
ncbi:MAG: hypothetical protein NZM38_10265 [Cytophagales bacterium]|nr:hypothetical protein [Cytophagales bacterium]MDW8385137.1 hypothetical protein [Flammeovirgaceae bacterium]